MTKNASTSTSSWLNRQQRIQILGLLTTSYFVAELVVGHVANSISLVADSFHMISDVIALYIAWYSIRLATRKTHLLNQTYGWQRAEIIGAIVNGVFLLG